MGTATRTLSRVPVPAIRPGAPTPHHERQHVGVMALLQALHQRAALQRDLGDVGGDLRVAAREYCCFGRMSSWFGGKWWVGVET